MEKAAFLAHIRSLQFNLRQVLQDTKDSDLGTVIGHKLYPEFVDAKRELSRRQYLTHSVDTFLHVCREMVDMYKARIGKGMTPKAEPNTSPRAKLMEVIKKWESEGVFERDAVVEEIQKTKNHEGGLKGQQLEIPMEWRPLSGGSTKGETKLRGMEEAKENKGEDDSGKKGMKRKATGQFQRIVANDTEGAAVSEIGQKRLKRKTSTQLEREQTREGGNERLIFEKSGNETALKVEGGEISIVQHLQDENAVLRAQVDSLVQRLETQDQQIAMLLNGIERVGENGEEQEVIGLLFDKIDLSAAIG